MKLIDELRSLGHHITPHSHIGRCRVPRSPEEEAGEYIQATTLHWLSL